jgi:hypothetical protein
MGRLRLHERDAVRALWRGHFEAWRLSGLTQREYCERHGLSLKSFGNWRGQLKREDGAGRDARWGRHPRLKHMVSPMATPMANEAADREGRKGGSLKFFARSTEGRPVGVSPRKRKQKVDQGRIRALTSWCTNSSRRHHTQPAASSPGVSNSVPARSPIRAVPGSASDADACGRRQPRPAAEQQLCVVARCRNVATYRRNRE